MPSDTIELGVSEFVSLVNQTFEYAFTGIIVKGELANLRVSKGKWLYFDLKDETATVKFFGTIYQLPGPLQDGMILKVRGTPKLHHLYGFSVTVSHIQPAGEGSIKQAANLLQASLQAEGLFENSRKRLLPYPPQRIGLVTSQQSAAYADFVKIMNARWSGVEILLIDVQVQGEIAPAQIVAAISQYNSLASPPDVIVIIRGGGSAEDLAAFNHEQVTRAVAASRIPSLVAIGHEIDISLAELAADMRASTPSNAAELLVPDKKQQAGYIKHSKQQLAQAIQLALERARQETIDQVLALQNVITRVIATERDRLSARTAVLQAFDPEQVLKRGYAIIRDDHGNFIRFAEQMAIEDLISLQLENSIIGVTVNVINTQPKAQKGKRI